MTLRLLIDTCVWLDLAKDYRNLDLLEILDQVVQSGDVELIVPDLVIEEYFRSKDRVLASAVQAQKDHFKLVRTAVRSFGQGDLEPVLSKLDDVQNQVIVNGELSQATVEMVEMLIKSVEPTEVDIFAKSRAADRSLRQQAPFHIKKDSMGDALLIETYFGLVENMPADSDVTFAFVTTNTTDFSQPGGHTAVPHADFAGVFNDRSTYSTSLPDTLRSVGEELFEEHDAMFFSEDVRTISEIREAEQLLYRQVWYNRHWNLRVQVESGEVKQVTGDEFKKLKGYHPEVIVDAVWQRALAAAKKTEDEVGLENLGPWDDFEWGMLNGKLSALRWVLGDDWDMLDT